MMDYSQKPFTQWICWKCGYYEDNSPAYLDNPKNFKDLIRNNPTYLQNIVNRNFTSKKSTADYTEPGTRFCKLMGTYDDIFSLSKIGT